MNRRQLIAGTLAVMLSTWLGRFGWTGDDLTVPEPETVEIGMVAPDTDCRLWIGDGGEPKQWTEVDGITSIKFIPGDSRNIKVERPVDGDVREFREFRIDFRGTTQ